MATPATAPHAPIACPRLVAGKTRVITAIVWGLIIAAPSPWKTRATTSGSMDEVSPHHAEETVKTVSPAR